MQPVDKQRASQRAIETQSTQTHTFDGPRTDGTEWMMTRREPIQIHRSGGDAPRLIGGKQPPMSAHVHSNSIELLHYSSYVQRFCFFAFRTEKTKSKTLSGLIPVFLYQLKVNTWYLNPLKPCLAELKLRDDSIIICTSRRD